MPDICYYNETDFANLLTKPKEEVKRILIEQIQNGSIEYPIKDISEEEMQTTFQSLCNYIPNKYGYSVSVFSRYPYSYSLSGTYIPQATERAGRRANVEVCCQQSGSCFTRV